MTLNTFTPSSKELAWWKVMQSPDLLAILKDMENGAVIRDSKNMRTHLITPSGFSIESIGIRKLHTLERAGLIAPVEYDDYIEYRLTYTGTFEELVRHANNQDTKRE